MKVSIIIPYRIFGKYISECLDKINELDFKDYEVILLPDEVSKEDKKYIVKETGKVTPSAKRNLGVKLSKGELIAFVDDDAYPDKNWLKNSIKYFEDSKVGIVGGPNLTPKNVNLWEKISGDCLSMFVCSGSAAVRYKIGSKKEYVDELPTCNLLIRRELFKETNEDLLTAEDTQLCFHVTQKGKKVLYVPDVVVYHHRRDSFGKHLKQMWIYGRDVAFLMKAKIGFKKLDSVFLSLWVLFLLLGWIPSFFREFYFGIVGIYLVVMLASSLIVNLKRSLLIFLTAVLTHISYGIGFIYGIVK